MSAETAFYMMHGLRVKIAASDMPRIILSRYFDSPCTNLQETASNKTASKKHANRRHRCHPLCEQFGEFGYVIRSLANSCCFPQTGLRHRLPKESVISHRRSQTDQNNEKGRGMARQSRPVPGAEGRSPRPLSCTRIAFLVDGHAGRESALLQVVATHGCGVSFRKKGILLNRHCTEEHSKK